MFKGPNNAKEDKSAQKQPMSSFQGSYAYKGYPYVCFTQKEQPIV